MKLRLHFLQRAECHSLLPGYRVNFKLTHNFSNTIILLRGSQNSNKLGGWKGLHKVKFEQVSGLKEKQDDKMSVQPSLFTTFVIDTDEWTKMDERSRLNYLYNLTHAANRKVEVVEGSQSEQLQV